jgi:hypothetical protein
MFSILILKCSHYEQGIYNLILRCDTGVKGRRKTRLVLIMQRNASATIGMEAVKKRYTYLSFFL